MALTYIYPTNIGDGGARKVYTYELPTEPDAILDFGTAFGPALVYDVDAPNGGFSQPWRAGSALTENLDGSWTLVLSTPSKSSDWSGAGIAYTERSGGGGGAVDSVFGRTGAVVAASDYDASQVDNDSAAPGATVADALDDHETRLDDHTTALGTKADKATTVIAGAGLTGGGTLAADRTINVAANADGSIVVNADDIQVGVLATDAQHGTRGGGTQHAAATTSVAGFLSAADKTKLDAIAAGATANAAYTSNPAMNGTASPGANANYARGDHVHPSDTTRVPTTRTVSAGNGLTGGGALSGDISLAVSYYAGTQGEASEAAASSGVSALVARGDHRHQLATRSVQVSLPVTVASQPVVEGGYLWSSYIESPYNEDTMRSVVGLDYAGISSTDFLWVRWPIPTPAGLLSITGATAIIQGNSGHSGVPALKPTLKLQRHRRSGTTVTVTDVATVNDASVSVGAYEAAHALTISVSTTVTANDKYYLVLTHECSSNALGGLKALWAEVTLSVRG